MSQWVQHKSGQGGKWELSPSIEWTENGRDFWKIKVGEYSVCSFPKSEYILTDPPEEWQDVTGEFHATEKWPSMTHSMSNGISGPEDKMFWIPSDHHDGTLMLRKIDGTHNGPCFTVERRKV